MLQGEFSGSQLLSVAVVMRVAKNPMQWAQIHSLIFQELESRSYRGHKVMILATSSTVKKRPITHATPLYARPGRCHSPSHPTRRGHHPWPCAQTHAQRPGGWPCAALAPYD